MRDELINIWEEGNKQLFRDEKTDRKMITQYLNEKTLKGSRSVQFNILFYWLVQLANLVLVSMNLVGYRGNTRIVPLLVVSLVASIGILLYGIQLFYRLKEINNYSESLGHLITKQLKFFRWPYEIWLMITSVSAIMLMLNLNLYIDNDNGNYPIHNRLLFAATIMATLLFIYGSQKIVNTLNFRSLKVYLDDLQHGVLDQSLQLERKRKRHLWLWILLLILLTVSMVIGILTAAR
jgi:hypothetical protein